MSHPRVKVVTLDWLIDSICAWRLKPFEEYKSMFGNGSGKLTVVVPTLLVDKFRAIAGPNSRNNIETIGILGGKLAKNK